MCTGGVANIEMQREQRGVCAIGRGARTAHRNHCGALCAARRLPHAGIGPRYKLNPPASKTWLDWIDIPCTPQSAYTCLSPELL